MKTHRLCKTCFNPVKKETRLNYPFYCPNCNENKYRTETTHKREIAEFLQIIKEGKKRKQIT